MKRVTTSQEEHFARIEAEFDEPAMDVIRVMYDMGIALRIIGGAIGVPGDTLMGWVRRWGWSRPDIGKNRAHPAYVRITERFGHDAISLVCSDRKLGLKYREIAEKYNITNPTIIRWLRIGEPDFVGTKQAPVLVSPPEISDEERERRRAVCIEHNRRMKKKRKGWFAWSPVTKTR